MQCSHCGAQNQPGAVFCEMCGSRLTAPAVPAPAAPSPAAPAPALAQPVGVSASNVCPSCGTPAIPGEAFCDNCGATLNAPAAPAAPLSPTPPAPQQSFPAPQPVGVSASNVCPSCGTPAIPGEAFCDTCGAALSATPAAPAAPAFTPAPAPQPAPAAPAFTPAPAPQPAPAAPAFTPAPAPVPQPAPAAPAYTPPAAPAATSLGGARLLLSNGSAIALPNKAEAIIGRQDSASGHFPDVDLAPYGAFEHGVGRRHARLVLAGGRIAIEDLDSTNGTLVNQQRLLPKQQVPLNDGDKLHIGKLELTFRVGAV